MRLVLPILLAWFGAAGGPVQAQTEASTNPPGAQEPASLALPNLWQENRTLPWWQQTRRPGSRAWPAPPVASDQAFGTGIAPGRHPGAAATGFEGGFDLRFGLGGGGAAQTGSAYRYPPANVYPPTPGFPQPYRQVPTWGRPGYPPPGPWGYPPYPPPYPGPYPGWAPAPWPAYGQ